MRLKPLLNRQPHALLIAALLSVPGLASAEEPHPPLVAPAPAAAAAIATANALANGTSASGSSASPPIPPPPAVDADTVQLGQVAHSADELQARAHKAKSEATLVGLRQSAATTQAKAEALAARRRRELSRLTQRLKALSTPQGAERGRLTPSEHDERLRLLARSKALQDELKLATHAATAASETYVEVSNERRTDFDAKLLARTSSPLELDFWTGLSGSIEPDTQRVRAVADEAQRTLLAAPEPQGLLAVLTSLVAAALLAWPFRRLLLHLARRRATSAGRSERFGRSAHELALVIINTAVPAATAICIKLGLSWGALLSPKAEALVQAVVIAVIWGAAVLALARQLAGEDDGDEGLVAVSHRLSKHMRALPWLVVVITGAGFLLSRLNNVVGASLAATIAANCVVSLAYAGVASLILIALGAGREEEVDQGEGGASSRRALLSVVLSLAVVLTVGAVFTGYTTFAALVSSQMFWISVLAAASWLLLRFVDEFSTFLFEPRGLVGRMLTGVIHLRGRTSEQIGALASALLQIVIVLGALGLATTPFGRNGDVLSAHLDGFGKSLQLGSLIISPKAVGLGLAILLAGLMVANLTQRWVDRRFLPLTDWDVGVRASVSTGVRYLAISAAILWALAAAGLGFRQMAIVAGALSVGIGFGLQQIVQNFVSGLILLVERPVKVGDWISLAGVEGDVRRIRVRATEIRLFDRSTLIVPNSDLITKQVENKTLGNPHARLRIQLTINAAADAPKALDVVERVLKAAPEVLDDPKPGVFVDSISPAGNVTLNAFAYVGSPRDGYRIRSDLYIKVIEALGLAKVDFVGAGGQTVIVQPGDALSRLFDGATTRKEAPKHQS